VRGTSPVALVLRRGRLVAGEGDDDLGTWHLPTTVAAPLRGRERIRGVLIADARASAPVEEPARKVFDLLADLAGRAVENAEHFERLAREANTDPLTGLGSRASFDDNLRELVAAALNDGPPLGLLKLDLDDFKRVNEKHGQAIGDRVLAEIGRRLLATLRPGEGFRYQGEEFAVLLRGIGRESMVGAADRIWKAVTHAPIEVPNVVTMRIGCAIGGAMLPGRAEDAEELIRAADVALARAKAEGKNRIRFA
jgi:diguanylate cyclase (GGDEF)-like protein